MIKYRKLEENIMSDNIKEEIIKTQEKQNLKNLEMRLKLEDKISKKLDDEEWYKLIEDVLNGKDKSCRNCISCYKDITGTYKPFCLIYDLHLEPECVCDNHLRNYFFSDVAKKYFNIRDSTKGEK